MGGGIMSILGSAIFLQRLLFLGFLVLHINKVSVKFLKNQYYRNIWQL